MNRVTVSLVAYGPYILDFECGANNFIDVVQIVLSRLERLGYDVANYPMGKNLFINVR